MVSVLFYLSAVAMSFSLSFGGEIGSMEKPTGEDAPFYCLDLLASRRPGVPYSPPRLPMITPKVIENWILNELGSKAGFVSTTDSMHDSDTPLTLDQARLLSHRNDVSSLLGGRYRLLLQMEKTAGDGPQTSAITFEPHTLRFMAAIVVATSTIGSGDPSYTWGGLYRNAHSINRAVFNDPILRIRWAEGDSILPIPLSSEVEELRVVAREGLHTLSYKEILSWIEEIAQRAGNDPQFKKAATPELAMAVLMDQIRSQKITSLHALEDNNVQPMDIASALAKRIYKELILPRVDYDLLKALYPDDKIKPLYDVLLKDLAAELGLTDRVPEETGDVGSMKTAEYARLKEIYLSQEGRPLEAMQILIEHADRITRGTDPYVPSLMRALRISRWGRHLNFFPLRSLGLPIDPTSDFSKTRIEEIREFQSAMQRLGYSPAGILWATQLVRDSQFF